MGDSKEARPGWRGGAGRDFQAAEQARVMLKAAARGDGLQRAGLCGLLREK